jgi:hypothetical protein
MKISCFSAARLGVRILEAGLLAVLPLVFSRCFAEQFSTPKVYLTQILVLAGLAVWALSLIWQKTAWPRRFGLGAPLASLALPVLLSCWNSPVPAFSLSESVYFLCGPAWALMLMSWADGISTQARLGRLAASAGSVVAIITLLQWSGHDPLLSRGYRIEWGGMVARMHLYGTLGNPNFVGGYLIGTIFLALALAVVSGHPWARACWWASAGAMLLAILGADSHGAWAGLVAGLLVAGPIWRSGRSRELVTVAECLAKERSGGKDSSFFVASALILFGSLFAARLVERLLAQMAGRTYLWRFSWPMFAQHPLIGGGWGTYQIRYLELQAKFLGAHPQWIPHWANNRLLHNDPLQLLLETGALGFAALLWIFWSYGREVRRFLPATPSPAEVWWLGASAGGVTAILVDSLFNFQFAVPPTFLLLFTLLAFPALAGATPAVTTAGVHAPGRDHRRLARLARLLGSLAILISAGALLSGRTRWVLAERDHHSATLLESRAEMALAEETYLHGLSLNPLNGRLHFGLARTLYHTQRYPEALQEARLAERTYADSHLEVLKGRILDQMGMAAAALATYRHALELDPTLKSVQADIDRLGGKRCQVPFFGRP